MQMRPLARWLGSAGLILGLEGCVVHDTPPVNPGYGYGYGTHDYRPSGDSASPPSLGPSVGEPTPAYVSGLPPEPLYEQMSGSPGDGFVWIDGYWHWSGYEWVWVNGRWERDQAGYVYVEPNYDYVGDQYVYTPGYWVQPERAPRGWHIRDHRDGRPKIAAPPVGYRPPVGAYRPPIVRPRPGEGPIDPSQPPGGGGTIRDHRGGSQPPVYSPPIYSPPGQPADGGTIRDHRGPAQPPVYSPPIYSPPGQPADGGTIRDHRAGGLPGPATGDGGRPVAPPPAASPPGPGIYVPPPSGGVRDHRGSPAVPRPEPVYRPPSPVQPPVYRPPSPVQPPVYRPPSPVPAPGIVRPPAPVFTPPAPIRPPAPVVAPPAPVRPPPPPSGHPARHPR